VSKENFPVVPFSDDLCAQGVILSELPKILEDHEILIRDSSDWLPAILRF